VGLESKAVGAVCFMRRNRKTGQSRVATAANKCEV
jgi:hypothetical protein